MPTAIERAQARRAPSTTEYPHDRTTTVRDGTDTSTRRTRLIGLYLIACFGAQIWPIASFANRVEPRILGLPFIFAWYVGGVFAVFIGLLALYHTEQRRARRPARAPSEGGT